MIQKEYISKNRSKFLIKYYVILVCKYRKKLLIGAVEYDMKQIMQNTSSVSDFDIEVMETDKDHIHMMVCSEPKLSPLRVTCVESPLLQGWDENTDRLQPVLILPFGL